MSSDTPAASRPPRLNPFVFPSDTDFRFILLVVSVVGASLFAYYLINNYLFQRDFIELNLRCSRVANAAYPGNPSLDSPEGYQKQQLIANCLQPYKLKQATWIAAGMGLLLAVALVLYGIAPTWKIWRGRLTPLTVGDAPEVLAYLEKLCREVGVDKLPTFVWNPFNLSKSGLAFGRLGHYYVALPGGLVTLFYTDRPAFRAIMLHELAHLRNADIDKTYFAVAVWQAFVVIASVPFIGLIVYLIIKNPALDETNLSLVDMIWRVVPLAILVYLMRNAVLRTREIYADVRASVWDNRSNALLALLSTLPSPKKFAQKIGLSVHPDPNERQRLLVGTNRLFSHLGFWDAFATGMAVTITVPNVVLFLSLLIPFNQTILTTIAPALLAAPLIIGVLGVGVWRGSFALLWRSKIPRNIGRLGTGLGLGLMLGYALSFDTSSSQSLSAQSSPLGFYTIIGFMALPVCLFSYLFLRWMAAGASVWLESITTRRLLSRVSVLGYIVAGIILAACLGALFSILELLPIIGDMGDASLVLLLALISTSLIMLLDWVPILPLISIYPMAAVIRRRQARTDMQWAFLDALPQQLESPRQTPLHPWLAAIVGLLGGVIFCGLLLFIRIVLRITLPENLRNTDGFLQYFYIGAVALAVLMQTGVAVVVAVWVRRLGWVHGLFAAFVAGCVMTVGILGLNLLFEGTIAPTSAWKVFSQVVNEGALLALPFTLIASALSSRIRRSEAPSPQAVMV